MSPTRAIRIVTGAVGLFTVALGLWAFLAPGSFFERLAAFPPYNRHLIHDIGAFQVGVGAVLLFALLWADGLLVALAGSGVGFILHFFSHLVDRNLGGRVTDPISVGLLAAVIVIAALWRAQAIGQEPPTPPPTPPPDEA